jgi:prophage regulatory protein
MEIYRFADLKQRRIVNNRMTLRRWIDSQGFPRHLRLGPNSIGWLKSEVEAWLSARAAERDSNPGPAFNAATSILGVLADQVSEQSSPEYSSRNEGENCAGRRPILPQTGAGIPTTSSAAHGTSEAASGGELAGTDHPDRLADDELILTLEDGAV